MLQKQRENIDRVIRIKRCARKDRVIERVRVATLDRFLVT